MKKRGRLRKGLAMLLTAAMVVGLMPGVGTMKVSAEESEASGNEATAEGYDADGFCTSYELKDGTWALKSGETCTHGDCKGYQPAVEGQLDYDINGDETKDANDKAYKITNAGQLYWFADKVNNEYDTYKDKNAVLTTDITVNEGVLSGGALNTANEGTFRSWTPIGDQDSSGTKYPYKGIFDGAGNKITGLYFNNSNEGAVGLFRLNSGTIKNVGIDDSFILGSANIGGVCGFNDEGGNIEACNNNGFIKGESFFTGGVCGYNGGTITNCGNTGNVSGYDCVGGVCGTNGGLVKNCSNRGNVNATNSGMFGGVGGVCGYIGSGSLENSYNTGEVNGKENIGGVCGEIYSSSPSIKNCYYITKEENSITAIGEDGGGYKIYVEGKTSEEFSNGMVAYLLNSRSTEDSPVWYQNIDNGAAPDTAPVLDSSHGTVYASKPCPAICSNTESTVSTESKAHSFGEDNICTVCGAKGEIIDDPTLNNDKPDQVDGVYQIETDRQFYYFVALVNGRLVGVNQDTSASAVLKNDITVNAKVLKEDGSLVDDTGSLKTWVPIGYSDGVRVQTYTGTFDGGGHTISGLYFDDKSISYVGLFGSSTGTIKNVKVADSYFKGDTYVGGICGKNEGNIEGCEVSGKVEAYNEYADIGGICGYNGTGYVKDCTAAVKVNTNVYLKHGKAGGICGENIGTIEKCNSIGEMNINGSSSYGGGICGINNSSGVIKSCYNTGTVYCENIAGGICGSNNGEVADCYNLASVSGDTHFLSYVGGICGENCSVIRNCYNVGSVSGYDIYFGKVCGENRGSVTNCYYQDTSESDSIAGTTFKTASQFAGGEVAYLLNEGKSDNNVVWRQTLNTDTAPVLDSTHSIVYASKPCESSFANTEFAEEKKHTVTMSEDGTSHTCSVCKKTEQHSDVAIFTVNETNHSITAICPSCGDLGTITLSASGETYDGTEKSHVSGEIKGFTPTIVYEKQADNDSFETITSTPKDAGTYRASITYNVNEEENKVYSVNVEYTISPATPTITWGSDTKTVGYTGNAITEDAIGAPTVTLVNEEVFNGTIQYSYRASGSTGEFTKGLPTKIGTYEVKAGVAAAGNYKEAVKSMMLTIAWLTGVADAALRIRVVIL